VEQLTKVLAMGHKKQLAVGRENLERLVVEQLTKVLAMGHTKQWAVEQQAKMMAMGQNPLAMEQMVNQWSARQAA
jgi:predicted phosphodiesterase